jgi:hypothetical protein
MGKVETGNGSHYIMKVKTMAKVKLTKTAIVIDIMTKNAHLPADEVARMIDVAIACREGHGMAWYRWIVKNGRAPGTVTSKSRKVSKDIHAASNKLIDSFVARESKAKAKFEKSVRSINSAHKAKVELNVDEIAKIKEANLARMKEVSAKLKPKGKVRDFGSRVAAPEGEGVSYFDPTLAREEVQSILRDERLIDVCPKFVREDA